MSVLKKFREIHFVFGCRTKVHIIRRAIFERFNRTAVQESDGTIFEDHFDFENWRPCGWMDDTDIRCARLTNRSAIARMFISLLDLADDDTQRHFYR